MLSAKIGRTCAGLRSFLQKPAWVNSKITIALECAACGSPITAMLRASRACDDADIATMAPKLQGNRLAFSDIGDTALTLGDFDQLKAMQLP